MESDAYSSHVVMVHHPFSTGRVRAKGLPWSIRGQRVVPVTLRAKCPVFPGTGVPLRSAADPPAARVTCRNRDAAQRRALCSWPQIFQKLLFE